MDTDVYFKDIQSHIKQELNKAEESIFIAVAWFTDRELFDLLCLKARLNVLIELILINDEINNNSGIDYNDLINYGSSVTKISNNKEGESIMHNKFCIIDNKIVINGSYNWTNKAKKNSETITIHHNSPDLVAQFKLEFYNIKEKYIINDFASSSQIEVKIKRKDNKKLNYRGKLNYPKDVVKNKVDLNQFPFGASIITLSLPHSKDWIVNGKRAFLFTADNGNTKHDGWCYAEIFDGTEVVDERTGKIDPFFVCKRTSTETKFTRA